MRTSTDNKQWAAAPCASPHPFGGSRSFAVSSPNRPLSKIPCARTLRMSRPKRSQKSTSEYSERAPSRGAKSRRLSEVIGSGRNRTRRGTPESFLLEMTGRKLGGLQSQLQPLFDETFTACAVVDLTPWGVCIRPVVPPQTPPLSPITERNTRGCTSASSAPCAASLLAP